MKFKTKEDLMKEFDYFNGESVQTGIEISFNSFKERIDFYNKYKDKPYKDYIRDYALTEKVHNIERTGNIKDDWKDWLFDFCFGDIE